MFFWSFPSKAVQTKKNQLADVQAALAESQEAEKQHKAQLATLRGDRQLTKERKLKLEQLQALKKRKRVAEEEGKQFEQCDPERIKKLSQSTRTQQLQLSSRPCHPPLC